MRKFYTEREYKHVLGCIRKEYFDDITKNMTPSDKIKSMFQKQPIIPNEEFQKRLESKGFIYDPVGSLIKESFECFDVYVLEIPTQLGSDYLDQEDRNVYINKVLRKDQICSLDWKAAIKADDASKAIKVYAKEYGFFKRPEDNINQYLYSKQYHVGRIKYDKKFAIFAK